MDPVSELWFLQIYGSFFSVFFIDVSREAETSVRLDFILIFLISAEVFY